GNIGSQVSIMAEAMGMQVVYYDAATKLPHGNAKQIRDLRELLSTSDIVTLHVPSDATTRNMMNAEMLAQMKPHSIFLNYSRGDVVDLGALCERLSSGDISGAAVDVFPDEPEKNGDAFACSL